MIVEDFNENYVTGWIKMFRSFVNWEWYGDSKCVHLFLHCLLKANHKDKKWAGGIVKRGQFITSYSNLSNETGISVQSIRTVLNKLENTGELTCKSTNHNTIITICNYGIYQQIEIQANKGSNNPLTIHQQTINNPLTTTNKYKNEEEVKEEEEEKEKKEELKEEKKEKDFYFDFDFSTGTLNNQGVLTDGGQKDRLAKKLKVFGYESFCTENFINAWTGFKKYKQGKGQQLTDYQESLSLKKLHGHYKGDAEVAVAVVEDAVVHGWKSIVMHNYAETETIKRQIKALKTKKDEKDNSW